MTVTTEDGGRQNLFAKEPPMEIMDVTETHNERAERLNGRLAMLGVCLLYTSPSPRDRTRSRMPSSA